MEDEAICNFNKILYKEANARNLEMGQADSSMSLRFDPRSSPKKG